MSLSIATASNSVKLPHFFNHRSKGWPDNPEGAAAAYDSLGTILTRRFTTDRHFAAYSVPSIGRRLNAAAIGHAEIPGGVPMVLAVFDCDAPEHQFTTEWWAGEQPKLEALRATHTTTFVYRSRGGYRIVGGFLPEPIVLRSAADAEIWRRFYYQQCFYLRRRFGIQQDLLGDWNRLYRAPHATRDAGGKPESLPTIGDAHRVGTWIADITDADRAAADAEIRRTGRKGPGVVKVRNCRTAGESNVVVSGVLYELFAARGWVGSPCRGGVRVRCPWAEKHRKGSLDLDGSTILYPPDGGSSYGFVHCKHASHCSGRTVGEALSVFTPAEIAEAKRRCGVVDQRSA